MLKTDPASLMSGADIAVSLVVVVTLLLSTVYVIEELLELPAPPIILVALVWIFILGVVCPRGDE